MDGPGWTDRGGAAAALLFGSVEGGGEGPRTRPEARNPTPDNTTTADYRVPGRDGNVADCKSDASQETRFNSGRHLQYLVYLLFECGNPNVRASQRLCAHARGHEDEPDHVWAGPSGSTEGRQRPGRWTSPLRHDETRSSRIVGASPSL